MDQDYAVQIRRTRCGAIDDYHYYRIGRRIRSEAFHKVMKGLWKTVTGRRRPDSKPDIHLGPEATV